MPTFEGEQPDCDTADHWDRADRTIECCLDNVTVDEHQALATSDAGVDMQYCLQRCGVCYATPFFVVDGDVIRGVSHRQLLDTLEEEDAVHE